MKIQDLIKFLSDLFNFKLNFSNVLECIASYNESFFFIYYIFSQVYMEIFYFDMLFILFEETVTLKFLSINVLLINSVYFIENLLTSIFFLFHYLYQVNFFNFLILCIFSFLIFIIVVLVRITTPRFKFESLSKLG